MASAARRRTVESEARAGSARTSAMFGSLDVLASRPDSSSSFLWAALHCLHSLICMQARVLRAKTTLLEGTVAEQEQLLASLMSTAAIDADSALAALAATHWPADAKASVAALEAHTANLLKRVGEREARIKHLEETVLLLRARLSAPRDSQQVPAEEGQAAAGSLQVVARAGSQTHY